MSTTRAKAEAKAEATAKANEAAKLLADAKVASDAANAAVDALTNLLGNDGTQPIIVAGGTTQIPGGISTRARAKEAADAAAKTFADAQAASDAANAAVAALDGTLAPPAPIAPPTTPASTQADGATPATPSVAPPGSKSIPDGQIGFAQAHQEACVQRDYLVNAFDEHISRRRIRWFIINLKFKRPGFATNCQRSEYINQIIDRYDFDPNNAHIRNCIRGIAKRNPPKEELHDTDSSDEDEERDIKIGMLIVNNFHQLKS